MLYNVPMVEIGIGTNEQGQRLDRFLRKYLPDAPLSLIYRMVRKDVKVNGKREKNVYMLEEGDVVTLYLDQNHVDAFRGAGDRGRTGPEQRQSGKKPRRTFRIAYEDNEILIADKPAGLLTHGDKTEKSKHLANQVLDYLIEKGEYSPRNEKTFAPAPVNRIDRNTSGLVIFAKSYDALKRFNEYIRERKKIRKIYLTIVCGTISREMTLSGIIEKDEARNVSSMKKSSAAGAASGREAAKEKTDREGFDAGADGAESTADGAESSGRTAVTHVKPLRYGTIEGIRSTGFTLAEVEIETGRTHQIRVQLADAGYPLAGDPKYGDAKVNRMLAEKFGLTHQLLTAARLEFGDMDDYPELSGKTVEADLPRVFRKVTSSMKSTDHHTVLTEI